MLAENEGKRENERERERGREGEREEYEQCMPKEPCRLYRSAP
jgi:hypothetical protein